MAGTGQNRLQFSMRSLLILTGVAAILLTPLAWVARERQQMMRVREEVLRARADAIRAVVLAERAARESAARNPVEDPAKSAVGRAQIPSIDAGRSDQVERLERENAELKETVQSLRQRVERLKARQEH